MLRSVHYVNVCHIMYNTVSTDALVCVEMLSEVKSVVMLDISIKVLAVFAISCELYYLELLAGESLHKMCFFR